MGALGMELYTSYIHVIDNYGDLHCQIYIQSCVIITLVVYCVI